MASATAEHSDNGQMSINVGRVGEFLKTRQPSKSRRKGNQRPRGGGQRGHQQADVLITEMDGEDETVAQGRETLLALSTQRRLAGNRLYLLPECRRGAPVEPA